MYYYVFKGSEKQNLESFICSTYNDNARHVLCQLLYSNFLSFHKLIQKKYRINVIYLDMDMLYFILLCIYHVREWEKMDFDMLDDFVQNTHTQSSYYSDVVGYNEIK